MRPTNPLASLRVRLLALVLLALVPPILLLVWTAADQRRLAAEATQQEALRLVRLIASRESQELEQTQQLLRGLAQLPAVQDAEPEACREMLASLRRGYAEYLTLGVVDARGEVLCTAEPVPAGMRPGPESMDAVRRALATGAFTVGEYAIGRVSRRPILWAVQPLPAQGAEPGRVVFASLSLDWLNELAAQAQLPPGATLTGMDRTGTVLLRYPEPERWVGRTLPDAPLLAHLRRWAAAPGAEPTFTSAGIDGEPRFYGATRLPGGGGYLAVGVPTALAFEPAERALQRNLLLLGLVGLLVLALVWFSGDLLILRPVRALLDATRRIRAGDLSVRSGLGRGPGELDQLAAGFDRMAEALQQREREAAYTADILRHSEASYRDLFGSLTELVYIHDPHGRLVNVNAAVERLHGFARPQIIGEQPLSLMDPERADAEAAQRRFRRAAAGETVRFETWGRKSDGSSFPMEMVLSPGTYFGQQVVIAVGRDTTERRRASEALRESEARYRALFEQAPIGVFTYDRDLRVTSCNRSLAEILRSSRDRLMGLDLNRLHDVRVLPALRAVLDGRQGTYEGPYVPTTSEHEHQIWASLQTAPLMDADGTVAGGMAVVNDATARKELEQQLLQSQKMEAVGRLAGGVAHDFNNLLAAIKGNVELAQLELPEDTLVYEDLEQVGLAVETAAALTRQLLAFSRKQPHEPQRLDLNAIVRGTERMLRRLLSPNVEIATELAPDLAPVRGDPAQMEQVLMNLAINANDAMPSGGTLRIETANADEAPQGRGVVLTVSDTGAGMDEPTRARIFEPFFTTKEKGKGTGLGLSTVYGIVQQSGGRIEVESTPGVGTRFRVSLPHAELTTEPQAPAAAAAGPAFEPPPGHGTVLVVEDEAPVRRVAVRALTRAGYRVIEAAHAGEALRRLDAARTAEGEPIDLLLTDIVMPGMSGRELAAEARHLYPQLPVVFMTAYTDDQDLPRPDTEPLVQKPFTMHALLQTVRRAMQGTKREEKTGDRKR